MTGSSINEGRRWVLAEFPALLDGYEAGVAPLRLAPALARSVTFFDVETDPVFGFAPGAAGLPRDFGGDIGFELRLASRAVLSLQMSDEEIARRPPDVVVYNDSPTRVVGVARSAASEPGTSAPEVPIATVAKIGALEAWNRTKGEGVRLAVLDTGVGCEHPDLTNVQGWTFVPGTTPMDVAGHGTRCAGVLAARLNGTGLIGVAPEALLMSLKVVDDSGSGWGGWLAAGLQWCAVNDVKVASISLRLDDSVPTLEWLFDAICAKVLVVAAAGNRTADGTTAVVAPARYSSVMAVSGVDDNLRLAAFSRFGPEIDIAAPATSVRTTSGAQGYKTCQGTSLACPHVAGTAALVFSRYPQSTAAAVSRRLRETARRLGPPGNPWFGSGLVDADAATR